MLTNKQKLDFVYHNPKTGYRGVNDLAKKTKINPKEVKEYLESQDVYTKHFRKVEKFPRRRFFSPGIDEIWQADIVFLEPKWAKDNDGYMYLNLIIDTFSKYLWCIPLKTKQADEVISSFETVFKQGRIPKSIHSDKGAEYVSKKTQKLFDKYGIKWYTTNNETKAMIAERCALTLQQMMYKYLTDNNTNRWIDILDSLIENYNNSFHTSISMTPAMASKPENELTVYDNLYGENSRLGKLKDESKVKKFKVGDRVRTHKWGTKFDRGYKPTFADEILYIKEVINSNPPVYKLEDYHGKDIEGTYYNRKLVPYNKDEEEFEYDYIIKTKKTKDPNVIKAFVKWKGYSDRFNSWVDLTPEQVKESIFVKPNELPKTRLVDKRTKRNVAKGK